VRKGMGLSFIFVAVILAVAAWFLVAGGQFWLLTPKEKFLSAWRTDLRLLEQSKSLPAEWKNIRTISVRTDNSPAQDWVINLIPPIATNPNGTYKLDIFIVHWLEGYRYGAIMTYSLIDTRNNNNTIWELSRTHKLGIVY
jgi:hypothetical protein